MKNDIDIFIDVYNKEIINESFGTMLKNAANNLLHKATFGVAGKTKNKSLSENLRKALNICDFKIGEGDDKSFEEDFNEASKIIKSPGGKFYKIIITNEYNNDGDELLYKIRCINVISGKRVKINSNNFKLKTSWNEKQIIKAINSVVNPLDIKSDDATSEAEDKRNELKLEAEKPKKDEEALKLRKIKLNELGKKLEEFEKFVDNSPVVNKDLRNSCYDKIDDLKDLLNQESPEMEKINISYKDLIKDIREYKACLQTKSSKSSKSSKSLKSSKSSKSSKKSLKTV